MMKKLLSIAAMAAISVSVFTACSDDGTPGPDPSPVNAGEGVFVVNAGTMGNIPGSLTFIGNDGGTLQDAFAKANNNMALGDTPNDAIVYGSKLYIVVNGDYCVWVVDRRKLNVLKQISTTALMGSDKGKQPRRIVAAGGSVYISTFDGYIAAIDTTDYTMTACYAAGSYPEGMAVANGKLYVANSDLGQNKNPSISEIDLATGNVTDHKDALITNPVSIATMGSAMYVLDSGWYDDNWAQHDAGIRKIENGTIEKLADATFMAADARNGLVYYINSAYGAEGATVTYSVYDTKTGETRQFITGDGVDSPAAIAVDPVNGDVYISSYRISPDTGYADYAADGYVNRYRADGTLVASYDAGVGPTALAFNYHMTYE